MANAELSAKGEAAPRAKPTAAFRRTATATFRLSLKIVLDASGDLSSWHIRSSIPPDRSAAVASKKEGAIVSTVKTTDGATYKM